MKISVFGSKNYEDKARLFSLLDKNSEKIELIITTNNKGASQISHTWAKDNGVPLLVYFPKFHDQDGLPDKGAAWRAANKAIQKCDLVVVFWDKKSYGTQKIIYIAEEYNKAIKIFYF